MKLSKSVELCTDNSKIFEIFEKSKRNNVILLKTTTPEKSALSGMVN